jgi:hypothetical protein
MPRNVPVRLTSMTFCHLAISNLPIWPRATIAALLTSAVSLPNASTATLTAASHCSASVTSRWT